jgi:hypothetical protein
VLAGAETPGDLDEGLGELRVLEEDEEEDNDDDDEDYVKEDS